MIEGPEGGTSLTYLQKRSGGATLSTTEKSSISTSISTLISRLDSHFGSGVSNRFTFGSYTRDTLLPRKMDEHSDIDFMVVFAEGGYTPQTYLDRLRRFVEAKYSTSEIWQSSPTIVLELNHIKFELVPALKETWGSAYQIPNGTSAWQSTNPNDFNSKLTAKHTAEGYHLKPAIRLMKFWNAQAGYVYDSYALEKWIVDQWFYGCSNQRDYLFSIIDKLSSSPFDAQWRKDRVQRAKNIVANTRKLETEGMPYSAEAEVKKLIPE
jgi:predicted nucleotidyltransferase